MTNLLLCSFLFSAFAIVGTRGQNVNSVSVTVDKLAIAQLIDDTVKSAEKGVEASALKTSLESIQQLTDSYLNERNVAVDGQDIVDVLDEITAGKNWKLTLSALLEDPLVQEERKVKAGLFVLNSLSFRIKTENNDTQVNILVAAISFTAKSVGRSVGIGETLYRYNVGNNVNQGIRREWGFSGSASGSAAGSLSGGGGSASGSVSGSISGSVGYSSSGGFSGSLSGSASGSVSGSSSGDSGSSSGSSSGGSSSSASAGSSGSSGGFSGSAAGSASGSASG